MIMNRLKTTFTVALLLPLLLLSACKRRPLEDGLPELARIPVHIDWSNSGINPYSQNELEKVHWVSIRFFPKDGSPAFDRYLEEPDVTDGWINVPVGKYSVIVFNESLRDVNWEGAISFSGINEYAKFAAHAVAWNPAQWAAEFPYYTPPQGESVIIGPAPSTLAPKLASWSLDYFEVTENMLLLSQGLLSPGDVGAADRSMLEALTHIEMHCLTRTVNVTAQVKNLVSIYANYCALSGFAHTVFMASREKTQSPSIKLFKLNGRQYDANQLDGTTRCSFLSFGRVPPPETYMLSVDVLYGTGELLTPKLADFNVTNDVTVLSPGPDINININYAVDYRDGIAVNEWQEDVLEIK